MSALALPLLLSLALLQTQPARTAEPIDVEDLIRQGVDLRRAGKDARALPLFEEAYRLAPTPRTAAQLGLVEMALGYRLEAERHLHEALSAPHDLWVRKHREELEESLGRVRAGIGELLVAGSPAGAEVRVNGNRVGVLPLPAPVRLGEGPVTVELRAAGHTSAERRLAMLGGQRFELRLDLTPAAGTPAAGTPPPGTPPPGADLASTAPADRPRAAGPDIEALLGVQVWATGVKPAPEPSLAARLSAGYIPAALAHEPLALRLGVAVGLGFIEESAGRVYFTSLLATTGLRARLGERFTALADLGVGLLLISGIEPGSVLIAEGARTTGTLSGLEVRPSAGIAYALGRSLHLVGSVGFVWNEQPDEMFRQGSFLRFETGIGLRYRW